MPFNSPPSNQGSNREPDPKRNGVVHSFAQAERLLQIAFILPCGMLVGWGGGWWVDHHFNTHWATLTGIIVGITAGMVSAVRMALDAGKPTKGGS